MSEGNGHARDHDDDEVQSLKRRVGMLEARHDDRLFGIDGKIDRLTELTQGTRADVADVRKLLVQFIDKQIDLEKRVAATERKPRRGKKK